ncbi:MAG: nuclear transport factor 2 family protein [Dehalococcoidia bacterium]
MVEVSDSVKIRILYDIEGVKKVKRRYWRCVDEKRMDDLADCFTEDAVADYAIGRLLEGRDAIIEFLKESLARPELQVTSVHQGYNPDIEIKDEASAAARWPMYNYMIFGKAKTFMKSWQYYDDEYLKVDGEWKIKFTKITYVTTETTTTT